MLEEIVIRVYRLWRGSMLEQPAVLLNREWILLNGLLLLLSLFLLLLVLYLSLPLCECRAVAF